MSIYRELNSMAEHRILKAFDGMIEHITKPNTPNMAYPGQQIDIEVPHGSRDYVIVPDTVTITFNLDITWTDKARSVVNNVGRALVKKKELILGSNSIETINNWDIYDTYKELYLSEKEHEEMLVQGTQSVNGLKARLGAKKADGTALTLTTQESAFKKTLDNQSVIPLDLDFFFLFIYPYGLKEDLIVRIELNSAGKLILCAGDSSAIYKLSDISLEYDAIFSEPYATAIG